MCLSLPSTTQRLATRRLRRLFTIKSSRRSFQRTSCRILTLSSTHQVNSMLVVQLPMPVSLEERSLLTPMVDGAHMEVVPSQVRTQPRWIDQPLTMLDMLPSPWSLLVLLTDSLSKCHMLLDWLTLSPSTLKTMVHLEPGL